MHIAIIVYLCYTATILFIPLINEPWRLRNKEVSFLSMFLKKKILMLLQHMQKRTKIRIFFLLILQIICINFCKIVGIRT